MLRIYIKPNKVKKVIDLKLRLKSGNALYHPVTSDRQNPKPYHELAINIFHVAPEIPNDYVEIVTIKETIRDENLITGLYENEGSWAEVENDIHNALCQTVRIVANTVSKALGLYYLLRKGKLAPKEEWCGNKKTK